MKVWFLNLICLLHFIDANCQSSRQGFDKSVVFKYVGNQDLVDGNPIGGINNKFKPQYNSTIKYDYHVNNVKELRSALVKAKSGDVVFIDGSAQIDLSKLTPLVINRGITLMSNRGQNGSMGARLFTTSAGVRPMIQINGDNIKLFGLRIDGGDMNVYPNGQKVLNDKTKRNTYGRPVTEGISSKFSNLEICNCEIYGWSHAGIFLFGGANNINIHHNYIHGNKRFGLGYGIGLKNAQAIIKGNLFDDNRHDIAGTGDIGTSYEACFNIVIGDKDDHLFDMHGGADRRDNTNIAGTSIKIYSNYFYTRSGTRSVVIRGVPQKTALIYDNTIIQARKIVESRSLKLGVSTEKLINGFIGQRNSFGNIKESNNKIISAD